MTGKRTTNEDLPRYVMKNKTTGAYKYVRRVPPALHDVVRVKVWDLSLGSDKDRAYARATEYAKKHDALIDPTSGTEVQRDLVEERADKALVRSTKHIATLEAASTPPGDPPGADLWRHAPHVVASATGTPDVAEMVRLGLDPADYQAPDAEQQRRSLTVFLKMAFSGPPPASPADAMIYNAFRTMVVEALKERTPPTETPEDLRLTAMMAKYIVHTGARPNTAASYRRKTNALVRFTAKHTNGSGDRDLTFYDDALLEAYQDYLFLGDPTAQPKIKPVTAATVHQYFAPLKSMWKWAGRKSDYRGIRFPDVQLPKDTASVEDKQYKAFTDPQIKEVWRLLSEAWGPGSNSRLSPSRRAAFLMGFRVLLYTGLRPAEMFRIVSGDVEGGVLHIKHTKTKASRKIPVSRHIADFPAFLAAGGFAAEREAGLTSIVRGRPYGKLTTPESLAGTMCDQFRDVIHAGGIKHPKLVLYSAKHTLIRKLGVLGVSDNLKRAIIGHVGQQGALRNYTTQPGDTPEGMGAMRGALDAIEYW